MLKDTLTCGVTLCEYEVFDIGHSRMEKSCTFFFSLWLVYFKYCFVVRLPVYYIEYINSLIHVCEHTNYYYEHVYFHSKHAVANYGWFEPSKKYRLQMFKKIFLPTENTNTHVGITMLHTVQYIFSFHRFKYY